MKFLKKRLLIAAGAMISLLLLALGVAACGSEHEHSWGAWETVTPASCTQEGVQRRFCTQCDDEQTESIEKLAHSFGDWFEIKPSTCTEEGLEKRTCSVCDPLGENDGEGNFETRPIEKLAHSYSKGWETVRDATCTEEGLEQNVCDMCKTGQTRTIEKIAHSFGDWFEIEPSTCTHAGLQKRVCIVCNPLGDHDAEGNFETEPLDKLPHTKQNVEKVEANCLEAGHEAGVVCTICGEVIEGMDTIGALGHEMGSPEKISESTCTNHGVEKSVCTREGCDHSVETELPLEDHRRVEIGEARDATCTEPGTTAGSMCSVCEEIFEVQKTIPALGHDMQKPAHYDNGDEKYWHRETCSRCDHFVESECLFTLEKTEATCTEAEHHVHTCSTCGYRYEHDDGEPLGHNYGEWEFDVEAYDASLRDADGAATVVLRHKRVCSNAGHTPDPENPDVQDCTPEEKDTVAPTCTAAGYTNYECATCKRPSTGNRQGALGHEWEKNEDGSTKYTYMYYQGMHIHYRKCTRAGCEDPDGTYYQCHYPTVETKGADCEKGWRAVQVCADCHHTVETERGNPLGHSYTAWTHVEGTSGDASQHTRQCSRCEKVETKSCVMKDADKVATCQKAGQEIEVCEDCKYTEEGDLVEKLQHDVEGQPYFKERPTRRHYQICKRCKERVYESCPYVTEIAPKSCTSDGTTKYTCPACKDSYITVTDKSQGHVVSDYTDSDQYQHRGQCIYCKQTVGVDHDFSDSNICKVCGKDGLSYEYVADSGQTKAMVVKTIRNNLSYSIATPKIVIPEQVDLGSGKVDVIAVGTSAFYNNRNIREVVLPLSLEYINYDAFMNCKNLAYVSIAGHNVGDAGIADCKINRIENGAFRGCVSLTNAILPETLQYIGARAFEGCTALAEINIPAAVTEIQDFAFHNTAYYNNSANWHSDVLYIGSHLIQAKTSLKGSYAVNDGAVSISAEAFKDCAELTQIELPAALKAIDKDAFLGCTELHTVIFKGTFADYLNIRFDNDAASPMHFATTLTISGAVDTPHIPEGATVIPAGAFRGSKIEHIVIPASVTSIGANAFGDCALLTSVTFEAESKLASIGADVVKNTPFFNDASNWKDGVLYLRDSDEKPVALVAVNETKLQDYVKYEGEEGVTGSEGYKQVLVEEGTRVIAPRAFADIAELRMVRIAASVVYLGAGIFEGCTGLDRVDFRSTGMGWFAYSAMMGRTLRDSDLYGGENSENYAKQKEVARSTFRLYVGQWKRGNYGS